MNTAIVEKEVKQGVEEGGNSGAFPCLLWAPALKRPCQMDCSLDFPQVPRGWVNCLQRKRKDLLYGAFNIEPCEVLTGTLMFRFQWGTLKGSAVAQFIVLTMNSWVVSQGLHLLLTCHFEGCF